MYYTIFAKREENFLAKIDVAPLAGAWIEINALLQASTALAVAPLVGARIEMEYVCGMQSHGASLPSWERGLKYGSYHSIVLQW